MPVNISTPFTRVVPVNTAFLMHMDGTNGGTIFTEASTSITLPATVQAVPSISTYNPYAGTKSLRMHGQFLEGIHKVDQALYSFNTTTDFTIEMMFYPIGATGAYLFSVGGIDGVNWASISMYTNSNGTLTLIMTSAPTTSPNIANSVTVGTFNPDQWNHMALVRTGGTGYSIYLNGVKTWSLASTTAPGAIQANTGFSIGNLCHTSWGTFGAVESFNGWIDNLRITKGVARYSGSTITVPTANFPANATDDPSYASVILLMNMETANANTIPGPVDEKSGQLFTVVAQPATQPRTSTALAAKMGTSSAIFYPSGYGVPNGIRVNTGPENTPISNVAFGTGDFTVELWVYLNTNSATYQTLCGTRHNGTTSLTTDWSLGVNALVPYFYADSFILQAGSISLSAWHHVAVVRSAGVFTLYVDGVSVATKTSSAYNFTNTTYFAIGSDYNEQEALVNGSIDEVRLSKIARYSANFTPQTVQFEID